MILKRLQNTGTETLTPSSKISTEILVVDDEENVLHVLKRVLEETYVVYTATNGQDGLEILKQNPNIALILSDQRMPNMSGTEFLNRSIGIKPECVRIILTGYTDVRDLIESINAGRVFQYLTKPFEPDDLRIAVKRGIDYYVKSKELEIAHADLKAAYDHLKNAKEQLARTEKMSMLGQLMGSISHEIRNPINNIGNSVRLIRFDWDIVKDILLAIDSASQKYPEIKKIFASLVEKFNIRNSVNDFDAALQIIGHSCELVTEIIEDLRGFSRLDDAEFVRMDIHGAIERALSLLRPKFKHQVEFVKEFSPIPPIMGLSGPVSQVVINIINNAAQAAFDKKGVVKIKTEETNGFAKVSVIDNGVGIPPENMNRLFEPGFTTKNDEEGTGLGLTISYEIMQKHKGKIEVVSAVGKGSTFTLYFPIDQ